MRRSNSEASQIDLRRMVTGSGAPRANIAPPQQRPVHQALRGEPHRFQALEAELQQRRHHLAGRLFVAGRLRHHQPALEVGQPRRHHEIVGGDLDALFADGLDEAQILLGERQHRNLREVDLLAPRQVEQQVEWALVAVNVDIHDFVVGGRRRLRLDPVLGLGTHGNITLQFAGNLHRATGRTAEISAARAGAHRKCGGRASRWWRSNRRPAP